MGLHEVQEYRFGTQTWSFVEVSGIMPEPRWGHTAFVKDSVMYILGGKDKVSQFSDIFAFSFGNNKSRPHQKFPKLSFF